MQHFNSFFGDGSGGGFGSGGGGGGGGGGGLNFFSKGTYVCAASIQRQQYVTMCRSVVITSFKKTFKFHFNK